MLWVGEVDVETAEVGSGRWVSFSERGSEKKKKGSKGGKAATDTYCSSKYCNTKGSYPISCGYVFITWG